MAYEKWVFEQAFQLITAVSHQIVKIDFNEMEEWIDKIMGPKSLTDDQAKANMHRLKHVMRGFAEMRQVLVDYGIPVRDIQHYKDSDRSGTILEIPEKEKPPRSA